MRFCFFKNDKSTYKDELILFLIIAISLGFGISLVVTAPSFWIVHSSTTKTFGVICILIGVMYLPSLIYRLFTNDPKS